MMYIKAVLTAIGAGLVLTACSQMSDLQQQYVDDFNRTSPAEQQAVCDYYDQRPDEMIQLLVDVSPYSYGELSYDDATEVLDAVC